jgi:predicted permease
LLALVSHRDDRGFMLDDLDEEFTERAARDGIGPARRWYRAQVVRSLGPVLVRRARAGRARSPLARGAESSPPLPRAGLAGVMGGVLQDLRFAARTFARRPGFTAVALATLSVAIGTNTAIFSVVNGVLLRPVPGMADPEGLVEVATGDFADLSYPLVRAMAQGSASLAGVAAVDWSTVSVGGADRPEARVGLGVSAGYFDVVGASASLGRLFGPDEATLPAVLPVAVVSERLWEARFAGADIPGATLVVNGVALDVVGVLAGDFRGHAIVPADVFVPLGVAVPGLHEAASLTRVRSQNVQVVARLHPGSSPRAVEQELTALATAAWAAEEGTPPPDLRLRVDPWGPIPAVARQGVTAFLAAMLLLVALVLAMACVNVAGMVLARSVERGDEIAVRVAMGAGRGRITRQLLTEAALLALLAGGLGLPLAAWAGRLLLAFEPPLPPGYDLALDFGLDGRVLAFCFVVAVGSALLFNLAPALRAAGTDVMATIKGDGAPARRIRAPARALLVGGQMALSLVLLATAGLFLRSVSAMRSTDPGWSADGVYTADLDLELTGTTEDEGTVFFPELLDRLRGGPGIESAALAHKLPLGSSSSFGDVSVDGVQPPVGRDGFPALVARVSPGYFRTLDLAILQGRDFGAGDVEGAPPVAVVNRTMAERLWPGASPLGRVFRLGGFGSDRELTVVGVVEDARYRSLFEETPAFYYVPWGQWYNAHMQLFVKADPARAADVRARVAAAVAALQPDLPPEPLVPLESSLALALAPQRIAAWVTGVLGMLGLLLGAVGVYGVTAFAVGQRVREIGIRKALGATRRDVVALMLRQGMVAPLAGVAVGLLGALAMARVVSAFLAGVGTADPASLGGATLLLLAVAGLATLLPAWRAARGSPVASLRSD